ncbi:MAG: hypothetical protein MJK08_04915 [Campylobacterales bacterium]|nr:hypothetical protein [Campylobacterales bacterium]
MNKIKKLEELLNTQFIVELDESIEEMMNIIDSKKNAKEEEKELEELEELKVYFEDVLLDIKSNKLNENDAVEILAILDEMSYVN